MEISIPLQTMVKLVDAEEITTEKSRTFDLPLESKNITTKLSSQKLSLERFHSNAEIIITRTNNTTNKKSSISETLQLLS